MRQGGVGHADDAEVAGHEVCAPEQDGAEAEGEYALLRKREHSPTHAMPHTAIRRATAPERSWRAQRRARLRLCR